MESADRGQTLDGRATGRRAAVAVSVINFRTGAMTIRCVRSVLDTRDGLDLRVCVVDNRSGDGSADEIADWIATLPPDEQERVALVRSATNSGFSGGHNQGIAAAEAAYHLLLNSDAVLRPGALRCLLAAAEADPRAGLLAPRLENEDGTPQVSCFRLPTPWSELIRGAGSGPVTRLLARHEVALGLDPEPDEIGWVSFACVLLRREMTRTLGPMDEGYFLYSEDMDYCRRARRAGWTIRYVPEARVVHFRGGSAPVKGLQKARKRLPAYWYASRTRFFRRTHGRLGPLAANLAWHLGRVVAHLRLLAGRPVTPRVAHEPRDIWINFADPLGDRRAPED